MALKSLRKFVVLMGLPNNSRTAACLGSATSIPKLAWLGLVGVFALDIVPLSHSIRGSADEVGLLYYLFSGWDLVARVANGIATVEGRISGYSLVYLNTISSFAADAFLARLGFSALHLIGYIAFGIYLARLLRLDVAAMAIVIALALHPVHKGLMPPTAYPLQNDLWIFILIVVRCVLLGREAWRLAQYSFFGALMFLLVIASDYVFILASVLVVAECFVFLTEQRRDGVGGTSSIAALLVRERFRIDTAILVLAAIVHAAFRFLHPSQYDGNTLDGMANVGLMLRTATYHILEGLNLGPPSSRALDVPLLTSMAAAGIGLVTAWIVWATVPRLAHLRYPVRMAAVALGGMYCVTLPVAAASKYQEWCLRGDCGYLDSRTAYFGVAVVVICGLAIVVQHLAYGRQLQRALLALAIGAVAYMGYCSNWRTGQDIAVRAMPWSVANSLACSNEEPLAANLTRRIDPSGFVSFHPDLEPSKFWGSYLAWRRKRGACG